MSRHPLREIEKREYVAVKQRKHAAQSILDQLRTLVFALYDIEIDCPYAVALHSGRFAYLFNAADFVNHTVNVFRAILNQINIRRISYLRIGTCRIRLDISRLCLVSRDTVSAFVIAAVFFVFLFLNLPGLLCKFESKGIDVFDSDSLTDGREQRRVKYRLVGILGQSAHILHVWIFLYRQYCLLIRKAELMLYDEGRNNHAPRTVTRPDMVIPQPLVVDLLIFRPWKCVAQLHPPVGLRQAFKRTLHLVEGHLSLQGYDFHVGWSSFNIKVSSFLLKTQMFKQLITCYTAYYVLFSKP